MVEILLHIGPLTGPPRYGGIGGHSGGGRKGGGQGQGGGNDYDVAGGSGLKGKKAGGEAMWDVLIECNSEKRQLKSADAYSFYFTFALETMVFIVGKSMGS